MTLLQMQAASEEMRCKEFEVVVARKGQVRWKDQQKPQAT
jgi:hypothetical protein